MFFNIRAVGGSASWKEYFLWRDTLEKGMASGIPGADFKCKSLRGHAGKIVGLCYVGQRQVDVRPGELRSLVCSVSTDKTLHVWDAHEGTCLWRSPEQAAELTAVVSVPSLCLLASGNRIGHVSLWAVENGQCMASQSNPTPGVTSIVSIEDKFPSILIGDCMGKLHVLSLPDLERKHSATVFSDVRIDHLGLSSDKTLVSVASKEDLSGSPLMIYPTEQLLHPPEDPREAVKLPFPAASFLAACWLPLKPARLAALLCDGVTERVNIWDLQLKKDKYSTNINVADVGNITPMNSFPRGLLSCWGESVVFTASMNTLQMWDVFGKALSTFTHHREAITDIHVVL
uniref:Zgc:171857 n=1 Tax=Eptatretus burgeri TaxID=7764 RepID=A0A8C4QLL0_EPTBU